MDRILIDHETRLRVVERTVQGFIDRERVIVRGMSTTSKVLLLLSSIAVATLSVLQFFEVPTVNAESITALGTLVAALGTLVAAVGAVMVGWRNSRKADQARERAEAAAVAAAAAKDAAEASQREIIATNAGVFEVGKQLDGRLSQLLIEARATSRAEGFTAGEQAQRDRAAPSDEKERP